MITICVLVCVAHVAYIVGVMRAYIVPDHDGINVVYIIVDGE